MAATATPEFSSPEPSPAFSVKGKEALMDAVEDIVFGSVRRPQYPQFNTLTNYPTRLQA